MKTRWSWSKVRFTKIEKIILIISAFLLLFYWWFSNHFWFRIDDRKIEINQQSKSPDYSCFKSLGGEIFCYHQDNETEYLISPQNNEVYTVYGEGIIYLEGIVISSTFTNSLNSSSVKRKLPDEIIRGGNYIQFEPTIIETEWSQQPQVWRIYN